MSRWWTGVVPHIDTILPLILPPYMLWNLRSHIDVRTCTYTHTHIHTYTHSRCDTLCRGHICSLDLRRRRHLFRSWPYDGIRGVVPPHRGTRQVVVARCTPRVSPPRCLPSGLRSAMRTRLRRLRRSAEPWACSPVGETPCLHRVPRRARVSSVCACDRVCLSV